MTPSTRPELGQLVAPELAERLTAELGRGDIGVDSSIHHLTAAVGWRWLLAERLVVRASLGYLQAFSARSRLQLGARPDLAQLAEPTADAVLRDQYLRYIKSPLLGLGVGYRFF